MWRNLTFRRTGLAAEIEPLPFLCCRQKDGRHERERGQPDRPPERGVEGESAGGGRNGPMTEQ